MHQLLQAMRAGLEWHEELEATSLQAGLKGRKLVKVGWEAFPVETLFLILSLFFWKCISIFLISPTLFHWFSCLPI